jgi:hypothetical protein
MTAHVRGVAPAAYVAWVERKKREIATADAAAADSRKANVGSRP